jgi:hypothetical protein
VAHNVASFRYRKVRTKYGNQSSAYNNKIYHSKKEAKFAQDLDLLVAGKQVDKWERQVKIDLRVYDQHVTNYYMDFVIYWTDGTIEYVEVKGFETKDWKIKWNLFEAIFTKEHPEIKLTIVK